MSAVNCRNIFIIFIAAVDTPRRSAKLAQNNFPENISRLPVRQW